MNENLILALSCYLLVTSAVGFFRTLGPGNTGFTYSIPNAVFSVWYYWVLGVTSNFDGILHGALSVFFWGLLVLFVLVTLFGTFSDKLETIRRKSEEGEASIRTVALRSTVALLLPVAIWWQGAFDPALKLLGL